MARVILMSRRISVDTIFVGSQEVEIRMLDSNMELHPPLVDMLPFVCCFCSLVLDFDSKLVCAGRIVVRGLYSNLILSVHKLLFVRC